MSYSVCLVGFTMRTEGACLSRPLCIPGMDVALVSCVFICQLCYCCSTRCIVLWHLQRLLALSGGEQDQHSGQADK